MSFWDSEPEKPEFNFEREKQQLIQNMDYLMGMSVQEQTLYKKWVELQDPTMVKDKSQIASYYDIQWKPTYIYNKELTIREIESLEPYVEIVDDNPKESTKWAQIRRMIHTMDFTANPGRNVKINVKDRVSGKLLGQISLASDVTSMGVRDEYIGWSKDDKFVKGKLNYTTIASTIVCTQPLGYNFLGGKLVAMMTTVPEVRQFWKDKYGQTLIAVGTTSLYGIHSQYNGIPLFKTLGESKGKISIKPDDKYYDVWHHWLQENRADWYRDQIELASADKSGPVSGVKQKILGQIFKELGIKSDTYHHGFKRGVYFAPMYENGNQYLCGKLDEDKLILKPKFAQGDDYTIKWWKEKAIKRYSKLHEEGRLKPEKLFYADAIGLTWEEMKDKFLADVGR
jgi:hypothetical protein